jgi:hypothetical protein
MDGPCCGVQGRQCTQRDGQVLCDRNAEALQAPQAAQVLQARRGDGLALREVQVQGGEVAVQRHLGGRQWREASTGVHGSTEVAAVLLRPRRFCRGPRSRFQLELAPQQLILGIQSIARYLSQTTGC